jgi:site-specific recombinase XerD
VTSELAYWTVVDGDYRRVPSADEFLQHLRFGRDAALGTTESYARDLALFLLWCARTGRSLEQAALELHAFLAWLRLTPIVRPGRACGRARSPGRINHVLGAVRALYRHLVHTGRISAEVLAALYEIGDDRFLPAELKTEGSGLRYRAVPRHRLRGEVQVSPRAATRDEVVALLRAARHWRDRFLIVLLWTCGLRVGGALGLRRSDLHLVDNNRVLGCELAGPHLHVVPRDNPNGAAAKTRTPFHVPMSWQAVAVYEEYIIERDRVPRAAESDFVFVNLFHEPIGDPMRYATVRQLLDVLSASAGLSRRITPHMLRHAAGRALADHGAGMAVISEFLGQRWVTSAAVYTRPGPERMRQAMERVPPCPISPLDPERPGEQPHCPPTG